MSLRSFGVSVSGTYIRGSSVRWSIQVREGEERAIIALRQIGTANLAGNSLQTTLELFADNLPAESSVLRSRYLTVAVGRVLGAAESVAREYRAAPSTDREK